MFSVYAPAGSPAGGPFKTLHIFAADAMVAAIYSRVFGPASRAECEAFVARHATKKPAS
jgi:hypothetical protein